MVDKILMHRIAAALGTAAIVLTLGGFIWLLVSLNGASGSPFIIHFNDLDGITSTGSNATFIFMGLFGAIASIFNFFIAIELDARDPVLGKMFASLTLVFAILLFIGFASILNVN